VLYRRFRRGWPTSIVLLLLVVVAELSFTLCCHPPLCLHHLLGLIRATGWLVPLASVEALEVGPREGARIAEIAPGRLVPRRGASHAGIWAGLAWELVSWTRRLTELLREVSGWAAHRPGVAAAGRAEHLPALDEVIEGTVDLWRKDISFVDPRPSSRGGVEIAMMRPYLQPFDRHISAGPQKIILRAPSTPPTVSRPSGFSARTL
jgi:hypothetical protein